LFLNELYRYSQQNNTKYITKHIFVLFIVFYGIVQENPNFPAKFEAYMKHIVIIGAGRSSTVLIQYLLLHAPAHEWKVTLADLNEALAAEKIAGHPHGTAMFFDIQDAEATDALVHSADLVISMLPASFHIKVAKPCLAYGKHLITASYTPEEIKILDLEARAKDILILMECGLDPGIDHMSAMRVIDQIRQAGHQLTGFETFTGGLLAPAKYDNPWEYKFTWNPRNVVMAGTGVVKFIQEGAYKYIPYHRVFRRSEVIHIPGHGYFEGYANRDSLKYLDVYGLRGIRTLFRGTLRRTGFCKAWDIFVQIGATDDTYEMEHVDKMTHRDFINAFLSFNPHDSVELKLAHYMQLDMEGEEMYKLNWLGIFDKEPVGLHRGTPAQILEHILKKKWTMTPQDRDMIAMYHKFNFLDQGQPREIRSHMIIEGDDDTHTAMAKTVGLPMGIAARLLLEGQLDLRGVRIPIVRELYEPILRELEPAGLTFQEREIE